MLGSSTYDGGEGGQDVALLHYNPVHREAAELSGGKGDEVVFDPGLGLLVVDLAAVNVDHRGNAHQVEHPAAVSYPLLGLRERGDERTGGHHDGVGSNELIVQAQLDSVGVEDQVPHLTEGPPLKVELDVGQGGFGVGGVPVCRELPVDKGLEPDGFGEGLEHHIEGEGGNGLRVCDIRDIQPHRGVEAAVGREATRPAKTRQAEAEQGQHCQQSFHSFIHRLQV